MKYKLNKYVLGIIAIILALTGCSKNSDELASIENTKQDILTFANAQAFDSARVKVTSMKPEERVAWEKSQGFKSFGTICDEFYATIEPQNFKTMEDVNAFVSTNSDKVKIYENKAGDKYCEVQEFDNSERYLMNKDRMYIVGDSVVRKFDEGSVSTSLANIDDLKKAKSFSDLKPVSTSVIFKAQPTTVIATYNNIEVYDEGDVNDGWFGAKQSYRLVVRLKAEDANHDNKTYTHYQIQVANYVWHAVLFSVSRKTEYDITMYTECNFGYRPSPTFKETTFYFGAQWITTYNALEQSRLIDSAGSYETGVYITDCYVDASNDKNCIIDNKHIVN